jgi:hypothetical protein
MHSLNPDKKGNIFNYFKSGDPLLFSMLLSAYIILSAFLFGYLYLVNQMSIPNIFFWAIIISMIAILFIQFSYLSYANKSKYEYLMLLELVVLNMLLHGIYQFPFTMFFGSDAHVDMGSLKVILETGYVNFIDAFNSTSLWPLIHIFASSLIFATGLDMLTIIKYTPFLIELAFPVVLYYFLARAIPEEPENKKIAFISSFFAIAIFNHIEFSSSFIRQTIALPLIVLILYFFYFYLRSKEKIIFGVFVSLLVAELVLAHHFSSFMFLILCGVIIAYSIFNKNYNKHSLFLLVVTVLAIFTYWIYIAITPLEFLTSYVMDFFSPYTVSFQEMAQYTPDSIVSLRGYIVYYGFFLFNLIFGLILLYKYKYIKNIYQYALFLFLLGACGFIMLSFLSSVIYPDRLLTFGWLFGALPLIVAIFNIKNKAASNLAMFVVFLFIIYNIYQINPDFYTDPGKVIIQPSVEDYDVVKLVNMTDVSLVAFQCDKIVIIDEYANYGDAIVSEKIDKIYSNVEKQKNYYDVVLLNDRNLNDNYMFNRLNKNNKLSEFIGYVMYEPYYQKVTDSNNLELYLRR